MIAFYNWKNVYSKKFCKRLINFCERQSDSEGDKKDRNRGEYMGEKLKVGWEERKSLHPLIHF